MELFPGSSKLVEGDFPRGAYLLTGPSGCGKTVLCRSFVAEGLVNSEPAIYLSTDEDCRRAKASILELIPREQRTNPALRVVDAYSWRIGTKTNDEAFATVDPQNLSDLSILLDMVGDGLSNPRFVFDSISGLATQGDYGVTLRFLEVVTAKVRRMNAMAFFTLTPESYDAIFPNRIRTLFDGIFEMKMDTAGSEITKMLRVFSIKGAKHVTRWVSYAIDGGKIIVPEDFLDKLNDSIEIGTTNILGRHGTEALLDTLRLADSTVNPRQFHKALSAILGDGALVLERIIAKELFTVLDLPYVEKEDFDFEKCVNTARNRFAKEHSSKPNLLGFIQQEEISV